MVDRVLRIIVEGNDRSGSQVLRNVNKELGGLQKQYNAFSQAGKELVGITAPIVAGGYAIKKAFDFAQEGASLERLAESGDMLADSLGANYDEIIDKLDEASQGTIANSDLMLAANRAMMLGIGADADKLANLLEVAAYRGRAMGLETSQAFSDIVTGIGRMSPLILDNLGIVIDAEKRYQDYADSMGISTDAIDSATKRQILLNGVLEEGNRMLADAGGLAADAATGFEQLGATWKNVMDGMKKDLAEGGDSPVGAVNQFLTAWQMLADAVRGNRMSLGEARFMFITTLLPGGDDWQYVIDKVNEENEAIDATAEKEANLAAQYQETASAVEEKSSAIEEDAKAMEATQAAYDKAIANMNAFRRETEQANSALNRINNIDLNIGDKLKTEIDKIEWDQMGGTVIDQMAAEINRKLDAKLITPEQAQAALSELVAASDGLQAKMDGLSAYQAGQNMQKDLGGPLGDAVTKANDIFKALEQGTLKEYVINIVYHVTGGTVGGPLHPGMTEENKPGGATGLDMITGAGHPFDTIPFFARSGEHVTITPPNVFDDPTYTRGASVNVSVSVGSISSEIDVDDLAWRLAEAVR